MYGEHSSNVKMKANYEHISDVSIKNSEDTILLEIMAVFN